MSETKVWTIEVHLQESLDRTDAQAILQHGDVEFSGWGRARRNPVDPEVPRIGEELATARALSDLSHKLVDAAAQAIENFEGHHVQLEG